MSEVPLYVPRLGGRGKQTCHGWAWQNKFQRQNKLQNKFSAEQVPASAYVGDQRT